MRPRSTVIRLKKVPSDQSVVNVLVKVLSAEGMSTRAIAPIVGASNFTVSKDLQGARDLTPAPDVPQFDPDPIITGRLAVGVAQG